MLQALLAAEAARLPVPRAVPITERPLEQQSTLDGAADAASPLAADSVTSQAAAAAIASALGTTGALLLDEIVPPLADGRSNQPAVEMTAAADSPALLPPPEPSLLPTSSPPLPPATTSRARRSRPPPPPHERERPLLGNLTQITYQSSRYVRTHVGVEAACM